MTSIPPVSNEHVSLRGAPRGGSSVAHWLARAAFGAVVVVTLPLSLARQSEAEPAAPSPVSALPAVAVPSGGTDVQPTTTPGSVAPQTDQSDDAPCPAGMVEVEGEYCPNVLHRCVQWISQKTGRCAKYETTPRCFGEPVEKRFCMDRFEYPNQEGQQPHVGMTWEEAQATCQEQGKRLCDSSEWTLACEGPDRTPYPSGFERGACNVDQPYIMPDDQAFRHPATRQSEIDRLSQSEPSGVRDECVSHYGAYDLTGNVDEWVVNEHGSIDSRPYNSGLKGGYWGPVRNRCRPMTVDHNAWHAGYQIGFRCCADLPADAPE